MTHPLRFLSHPLDVVDRPRGRAMRLCLGTRAHRGAENDARMAQTACASVYAGSSEDPSVCQIEEGLRLKLFSKQGASLTPCSDAGQQPSPGNDDDARRDRPAHG